MTGLKKEFPNAPPRPSPTQQGSLVGKLDVDASGALDYKMDLLTPPGTCGMEPRLSLEYNSRFKNGIIGVGWRLRGLSAITRVSATQAVDGFIGAIAYDSSDRFALDGIRLVAISGDDGQDGTVYRQRIDSWSEVTSNGSVGSGPESFVVRTRDGRTMKYGSDSSGRIMDTGQQGVRVWALNEVFDLHGNTMTITYESNQGAYYPISIDYTSNSQTGLAAARRVLFTWEPRTDCYPAYQAGSPILVNQRLAAIQTYVQESLVSSCLLQYTCGSVTGNSILTSITLSDGDGNLLSPTTFTWQEGTGHFSEMVQLGTAPFIPSYAMVFPMDVNGDGLTDCVFVWPDDNFMLNYCVAISNGTTLIIPAEGVATNLPLDGATPGLQAVDVDGDGRIDLFYGYQSADFYLAYNLLLSDGKGGFDIQPTVTTGYEATNQPMIIPLDMDGDGRGEIVFASATSDHTLQYVVFHSQDTTPPTYDNGMAAMTDLYCTTGFPALSPANLNGDQMADLIYSYVDDNGGFSVMPLISNGTSFNPGTPISVVQQGTYYSPIAMPLDINGDGLHDVLVTWMDSSSQKGFTSYLFSNGKGFQSPSSSGPTFAFEGTLIPVDLDGDGRTDLLYTGPDPATGNLAIQYMLSNGNGFEAPVELPATNLAYNQYTTRPVGLQGCGKSDLINVQQAGSANRPSQTQMTFSAWLADPTAVDLLTGISTGYGGVVTLVYAPLTDTNVYQQGPTDSTRAGAARQVDASQLLNRISGAVYAMGQSGLGPLVGPTPGVSYPIVNFVAPVSVVSWLNQDYRNGTTSTNRYTYQGALLDLSLNQWLGFGKITKQSAETGLQKVTTYAQEFPKTGRIMSVTSFDPATQSVVSAISYEYSVTQSVPDKPTVALVSRSRRRADHYEAGVYEYSLGITYQTDFYGNQVLCTDQGYVDKAGNLLDPANVVYTYQTYINDHKVWRYGLPVVTMITTNPDANPSAVSPELTPEFDVKTDMSLQVIIYSSDGHYDMIAQRDWDDGNARWRRYSFGADRYGNRISVTNSAGSTWTTKYDTDFATYPTKRTAPATGGHQLTNWFAYDPRFGKQVGEADANGNVKITAYDGFGRLSAKQVTAPAIANIVLSPNLVPTMVTGEFDLAGASVVTVLTQQWLVSSGGQVFKESSILQSWPMSQTSNTLWERSYKDGFGRTILRAKQGDPSNGDVLQTLRLNAKGKTIARSLPFFGSAELCFGGQPAAPPEFTYHYDNQGRYSRITFPISSDGVVCTKSFSYKQQCQTVTYAESTPDQFMEQWQYQYFKSRARVISIAGAQGSNMRTYAYDSFGRMLTLTDSPTASNPSGVSNVMTYDSLSRKHTIQSPDIGVLRYNYDWADELCSVVTPAGTFVYGYDALGRPTSIEFPPSKRVDDPASTVYGYDSSTAPNGLGRAASVTITAVDGSIQSSSSFEYDSMGNRCKMTLTYADRCFTTSYDFDPERRPVQTVHPDGTMISRTYEFGNLTSLSYGDAMPAAVSFPSASYTAIGSPTRIQYSNGVTTTLSFSPGNWLLGQSTVSPGGEVLRGLQYSWSPLGQILSVNDLPGDTNFKYEALRLIDATGGICGSYLYDYSGNLVINSGINVEYHAHRAVAGSDPNGELVFSATYDERGNVVQLVQGVDSWTYVHDASNRLVEARRGGTLVQSYAYDAKGRRISRRTYQNDIVTETKVYPSAEFEEVMVGGDTSENVYLTGPLGWTGLQSSSGNTAKHVYFHTSHNGSTLSATDDVGNQLATIAYEPYGQVTPTSKGADAMRPLFTGKEYDKATSLYYFGARYYHPGLGRFLEPDPKLGGQATRQDATNRYSYVCNDPVNYTDPSGNNPILIWELIVQQTSRPLLTATTDMMQASFNAYNNLMNISRSLTNSLTGNAQIDASVMSDNAFESAAQINGPYRNLWGAYDRAATFNANFSTARTKSYSMEAAEGDEAVSDSDVWEPLSQLAANIEKALNGSQQVIDDTAYNFFSSLSDADPAFINALEADQTALNAISDIAESMSEDALQALVDAASNATATTLADLFIAALF